MTIFESMSEALRQEMERGRGGERIWPHPVRLEPPFTPFRPEWRRPPKRRPEPPQPVAADTLTRDQLTFLRVRLSLRDEYVSERSQQFLAALPTRYPVAFEVAGAGGTVVLQLAVARQDTRAVISQIYAHYPTSQVSEGQDWIRREGTSLHLARCYRLGESHLFQLRTDHRIDPFTALTAVLTSLGQGQAGLYQVLFQPVKSSWHENILAVSSDQYDPSKSSFIDLPDLPRRARQKVERPLFAVVVVLAASSIEVLEQMEAFLSQFNSGENSLIPVAAAYPLEAVQGRYSLVEGMLLNARELSAIARFPNPADLSPGTMELARKTARAPAQPASPIVILGVNRHQGMEVVIGLDARSMTHHIFIIGFTGSGKTTALKAIIVALMRSGYGVIFMDFAGDAVDELLDYVPEYRVEQVVYFNPADRLHVPALNPLRYSERNREMLASEVMVALKRLFRGRAELGPRTEWVLRQAIRAILASDGEKTLADIPRFLSDSSYREQVLRTVDDPELRSFWQRRGQLSASVIDPILTRLSAFLDRPAVRNIVSQPGLIDIDEIMSRGSIALFNLSKGILGEENSQVLGSLIMSQAQLSTMARAELPPSERRLVVVVLDEAQSLAGTGMDTTNIRILVSESRKYNVGFVADTQFASQLDRDVVNAIFGNVGNIICLRCGVNDAPLLQREMGTFTADDLLNLETGQAIVRMGRASDAFNVDIIPPQRPDRSFRERIVQFSRERYSRSPSEIERIRMQGVPSTPSKDSTSDRVRTLPPVNTGQQATTRSERAAARPPEERKPTDSGVDTGQQVDRELISYLEHIARHPFVPALQRDEDLGLSRYKGGMLRQRLTEMGWIRAHRVSTGRRSGQLVLLEATEEGYRFLDSMKIRIDRPRGRGGFVHRYYAYRLGQYARATWPGCIASIEDDSLGRPADLTVRTPDGRNIAFEVFMTGEAKEVRGIVQDVGLFDEVVVCAEDSASLESLRARAVRVLDADMLRKVTFSLVSRYLLSETEGTGSESTPGRTQHRSRQRSQPQRPARSSKSDDPLLFSKSEIEKNRSKSETEIEARASSQRGWGRRPRVPLMRQVEEAYAHLHDLDWLQECELARLPEVRERADARQTMPQAQALRRMLVESARQAIADIEDVPDKTGVRKFLERYLEGSTVTEIARELGVTREWTSRAYRREAFGLASTQFIRMVSREDDATG